MFELYALLSLAIVASGFLKLGFAIGAGLFLTPIMTAVISPPSLGIATMSTVLWLTDTEGVRRYWRQWDARILWYVLPIAFFGTVLGAYFLAYAPAEQIRKLVGALAALFVAFSFWQERLKVSPRTLPRPVFALLGFLIGFVGTVANAGGMIISLLLLYLKVDKVTFIATMSIIMSALGTIKLGLFLYLGILPWQQLLLIVLFFPLILLGGQLGIAAQKRVSQTVFRRIVSAGVFALSLTMVF